MRFPGQSLMVLAGLLAGAGVLAQEAEPKPGMVYYVAPAGNDAWSGTLGEANAGGTDGPFATLERAREAVRALKQAGPLPAGGVAVHLREGAYELAGTFKLTEADAGREGAPVVYRAQPGEKVILTGGKSIGGFVPHQGEIVKADVGAQGFQGVKFRQLLYNGTRQILARYPNFDPENPHGGGFAYVEGQPTGMYPKLPGGENVRVIQCKPQDVRRWARPELGEVIIYPRYNWNNVSAAIAAADPEQGTITLAKDIADPEHPQSRSIRPLDRYYVRNLVEELDSPGEWFLDYDNWTLYFWPPGPLAGAAVRAPVLETLVEIGPKADWITLRGFVIEGCDGVAVQVQDSANCLIAGNTIHDTGGKLGHFAAVTIRGGKNCGVVGNDLYEIYNYAIRLESGREERETLTPTGHYAENNYLHHIGGLNGHGCGIYLAGVGLRVSHNLIHDTTRCGIFGGGNDCVVEYNHIRHVNLHTEDTGGYYVGGNWHVRGHIIRYNYVHDVLGYGRVGDTWTSPHYTWGIYLDDDHSGAHVYGNIVARTMLGGSHIHAGRDNVLENNIFIDHIRQQMQFSGHTRNSWVVEKHWQEFQAAMAKPAYREKYPELVDADPEKIWQMTGNVFRRNIIYYTNPEAKLYQLRTHDGNVFSDNQCDGNLVWHAGLPITVGQYGMPDTPGTLTWEQWLAKGFDTNSLVADPLFVDAANGDYRLRPVSPAFQLGFEPIPVDKIGPYASPLRASWPIVEAEGVREKPLKSIKVELPPAPAAPPRAIPRAAVPKVPAIGEWPGKPLPVASSTNGSPIRTAPCEARLAHDGTHLFVALTVPAKDVGALKLGSKWTQDDAGEVCFRDLSGAQPGPTFVLHGFAAGSHESVAEAGAPVATAKALGEAVRFTAAVDEGRWTGVWTIPLAAAGIQYQPGLELGFNLGVRRTEADEWIQWVGSGATHSLDKAGIVRLE
ncbi:MAG: right-handed parallel beta-helix repeat-containing protein [Lentisphaeria bacterium]|nr:right-handed parallel beta-helix repeat-containing protein [Lentisphaeria bacterium]